MRLYAVLGLIAVLVQNTVALPKSKYRPIIFVSGFGGSQVYSKQAMNYDDAKQEWLTAGNLLFSKGYIDKFRLLFNDKKNISIGTFQNFYFPGTDNLWSLEYLGKLLRFKTIVYYSEMVKALKKIPFYKRVTSLSSVMYDWRKLPSENKKFIPSLKKRVESMYRSNGKKRVMLIGHSMGGIFITDALHKLPLKWRKKYIYKAVYLGSPLGGAAKSVKAVLFGENFGVPFVVKSSNFRRLISSFPTSYLLFPRKIAFKDRVLYRFYVNNTWVKIRSDNLEQIFDIIKHPMGKAMYHAAQSQVDFSVQPEGVSFACIYGRNSLTIEGFSVDKEPIHNTDKYSQESNYVFDVSPNELTEYRGDGTVNIESLRVCESWTNSTTLELSDVDHLGVLADTRAIKYILSLAQR